MSARLRSVRKPHRAGQRPRAYRDSVKLDAEGSLASLDSEYLSPSKIKWITVNNCVSVMQQSMQVYVVTNLDFIQSKYRHFLFCSLNIASVFESVGSIG